MGDKPEANNTGEVQPVEPAAEAQRDPARWRRVTLETPLKRGDQTVATVWLRKPMGGDLRGLSTSDLLRMDANSVAKITPRISEPHITEPEFWTLDGSDIANISGEVAAFLLTRAQKRDAGLEI